MKTTKFITGLLTAFFIMTVSFIFAQTDSTGVVVPDGSIAFGLSLTQVLIIVGGILEIILRTIPAAKNISILHLIVRIIDFIVPNKATPEVVIQGGEEIKKKKIFSIFKRDK